MELTPETRGVIGQQIVAESTPHGTLHLVTDGDWFFNIYNPARPSGGVTGEVVSAIETVKDEAVTIRFKSGRELIVSLRPDDYLGPEAMTLGRPGVSFIVWQ